MNKLLLIAAGLFIGLSLAANTASAQYGASNTGHALGRPAVSPYSNLVVSDLLYQFAGIGGGYQTLVRPFVDGRRANEANAAAITQLQGQIQYGRLQGASPSGSGTPRYMNYSHYYGR